MANEIVLFDLPSKGECRAWSLNPWKARLSLNYKGLPYRTEWTEYPDIKPKFQSFGIPPNTPDDAASADYSIPAARLPDGTYVMNSMKIARALEKLQPEPSLHLDNGYIEKAQPLVGKIWGAMKNVVIPRVPAKILNPSSAEYFKRTREEQFGRPLEELPTSENGGENAWKAAQPAFEEIAAMLHEHEDGPYIMGTQPSFADFVIAGMWRMFKTIDEGDLFERCMKIDAAIAAQYKACSKWLVRDDH